MNIYTISGTLLMALALLKIFLLNRKLNQAVTISRRVFKLDDGKKITMYFSDYYLKKAKKFFPNIDNVKDEEKGTAPIIELPLKIARKQFTEGFVFIREGKKRSLKLILPNGKATTVRGKVSKSMREILESINWKEGK